MSNLEKKAIKFTVYRGSDGTYWMEQVAFRELAMLVPDGSEEISVVKLEKAQEEIKNYVKAGRIGHMAIVSLTREKKKLEARLQEIEGIVAESLKSFPDYIGRATMYERDSEFYRKHQAACVVRYDYDKLLNWRKALKEKILHE